jgi:hypothetical protein
VRIRSEGQEPTVDLAAAVTQLEANVDLQPSVFAVDVPSDAVPLSVEELREAGPLRSQ